MGWKRRWMHGKVRLKGKSIREEVGSKESKEEIHRKERWDGRHMEKKDGRLHVKERSKAQGEEGKEGET